MAAALISPKVEIQTDKMDLSSEFKTFIERATVSLLLKDFKNCEKTCMCGMARAKLFIDDDRAKFCTERLCVLCIQALAEMNRWQDVIPLVQHIYNSLETCPYTVIQLCILLHARVKEYTQCHAMSSVWLRCEDNSCRPGYVKVASLYVEHVMLPQGRFLLVPQFLNSCTFLSEDVKGRMLTQCELMYEHLEDKAENTADSTGQSDDSVQEISDTSEIKDYNQGTDSSLTKYIKYFGCLLAGKLTYPTLDILWKIAVVLVSFGLLAQLALKGDLADHFCKVSVVWQNMQKMLKALFTPYRPGR